jgi:3-deoxy-D-manno-octulosonate 8-phosphate phosphatase (KDO 8-P phosphatase)
MDKKRLKKIKMLLTDVDGVLTDTRIFFDGGEWKRFFSIRDGLGLIRLQEKQYQTGFITTSKAEDIKVRAKNLGILWFYEGVKEKEVAFEEILSKSGLSADEIAYIGDDYPDLGVLKRVGFSCTVPESFDDIKKQVDYVTKRPGGVGAVREVCELILKHGFYSKTK